MNLGKSLFSLCAGLLMCACGEVYVSQPVGDEPLALNDSWSGTWISDGDILHTNVVDAESGLLQAAWIELNEDGFKLEQYPVEARRSGEHMFINVLIEEEDGQGYIWALVRKESDDEILLWSPDTRKFAALVRDGAIPGRMQEPGNPDNDSVVLEKLEGEYLERTVDPASGLLDWQNPMALERLLN